MNTSSKKQNLMHALRRKRIVGNARPSLKRKPLVILFCDDSTLIFARRMRDTLLQADPDCPIQMAWFTDESALSYRQICQLLPEGPDRIINGQKLTELASSKQVGAILTSRVFGSLTLLMKRPVYRWSSNRPCIISFLGGLDFFPKDGFTRRSHCDGVYLFPHSALAAYHEQTKDLDAGWQNVGFGHPSVLIPEAAPDDLEQRRDIFFFTQALSPLTKSSRLHILHILIALARSNPDRRVLVKLRHLPDENRQHLHLERFDYPGLMTSISQRPLPDNFVLTDMGMDEALETAALGITCTSTAAIDVVRAGVPCMVYLDYVDAYRDPLVAPMRNLFEQSNLITPLDQILALEPNVPDPEWVANMFCERDLGARVLETIDRFDERPFQIKH